MRLWIVSSSYPRHPAESINAGVLARQVALSGAGLGHQVTVVTPAKPGGVHFDAALSGVTIPWPRPTIALADLNARRPGEAARAAALMASARQTIHRLSVTSPPEGIIALWGLPSGLFARWAHRKTGAPYVTWLLGSDVWRAHKIPFGVKTLAAVLRDSAANFADGSTLAEQATALTGSNVGVLWSARELPPPPDVSRDGPDILFVGRYHRNKGPDILLEALVDHLPGADVELYGHGELEADLVALAGSTSTGSSAVHGPIGANELSAALRSARALVIPSRVESVPLILGDAIQAGVPVVVTDCGDLGEIVRRYGLGLVVPVENRPALASAIATVLDSSDYPDPGGLAEARAEFSPVGIASSLISPLTPPSGW